MTPPAFSPITTDVLIIGDGPGAQMAAATARSLGAPTMQLGDRQAWGAFDPGEIAAVIEGVSTVIRPRCIVLAQSPIVLANGAQLPETSLARGLGAAHAINAQGVFETRVDDRGQTSVDGVTAIRGIGSARLARAQARLAVTCALGADPTRARAALERALTAEPVAKAAPSPDLSPSTMACVCEGISIDQVQAALAAGAQSVPAVKRATRAGMGVCQGRLCAHVLHALAGDFAVETRHVAPRAPIFPVSIAAIIAGEESRSEAEQTPISTPAYNRWVTVQEPASAPPTAEIVVIGAGVVGLCAALELAAAGRDVLLIDRAEPGLAASTANAGSLHVQLLPYDFEDGDPGPLGEALALGPPSIALWRQLEHRAAANFGIRTEGGLVLAANRDDLAWLSRKADFERSRGIDTAIIGANELARMAPALARTYAGAAFNAAEGQIDPLRGTMALVRLVHEAGIRVASALEVRSLNHEGPGWRIGTNAGDIRAKLVLNAAGAHAGRVAALAGVALPVRAVVQQVIATAPAPPMLRHLVAQARLHLSLKQKDAGQLVIGGGWPGRLGADGATRLARQSIQGNLQTAVQVMPDLAAQTMVRAWTGLTVHLDRGPVIGRTPGHPGLFQAVTANGYTLGPIIGQLVANAMLARGDPPATFAL